MRNRQDVSEIDGNILDTCSVDQNNAETSFKHVSLALAFLVDYLKCQNMERAISCLRAEDGNFEHLL